jgi:hypothetical protein
VILTSPLSATNDGEMELRRGNDDCWLRRVRKDAVGTLLGLVFGLTRWLDPGCQEGGRACARSSLRHPKPTKCPGRRANAPGAGTGGSADRSGQARRQRCS